MAVRLQGSHVICLNLRNILYFNVFLRDLISILNEQNVPTIEKRKLCIILHISDGVLLCQTRTVQLALLNNYCKEEELWISYSEINYFG